jgi:hypothetical protein
MAEVAVFGVHFKHLYTDVNGVGKHKSHQLPLLVVGNAPSSLASVSPSTPSSAIEASRDKPENQRNRADRKIPHARPDGDVSSPDPIVFSLPTAHCRTLNGVSSPGPSWLATRLYATKWTKTVRTLPANGQAYISSMVQLEPHRPLRLSRIPGPAEGCERNKGEQL